LFGGLLISAKLIEIGMLSWTLAAGLCDVRDDPDSTTQHADLGK
jgi:hypothetical protein